jgi:acyl-CoA dehydrogenase
MNEFADALQDLLENECTPERVRAIEADPSQVEALWNAIEASGFADALVPEARGGAGQALAGVFGLFELCGRHALPVPLAETMVARAVLVGAAIGIPRGSIALAQAVGSAETSKGALVRSGRVADWVLLQRGSEARLLPRSAAHAEAGLFPLDATLSWTQNSRARAPRIERVPDLTDLHAMVCAALIAGALKAVFDLTLAYANEREQFGRPIGKFQAIQHQLSVMAEHVFAARMAAQLGCQTDVRAPDRLRVAIAKARASEAARQVAALAHAIHGAIGFTAEFDLQLYTRRLHAWRQTAGSEGAWQAAAGRLLVASGAALTLDVIRAATDPDTATTGETA